VGERRWSIQVDQPQPLLVALYLRDAAGLHPAVDPALPPADPLVVERDFPDLNRVAAAEQWAIWWENLLYGSTDFGEYLPPDFPGFDSPQLWRIPRDVDRRGWERTEHQASATGRRPSTSSQSGGAGRSRVPLTELSRPGEVGVDGHHRPHG
jgi:hypothetical protein